MKSIPLINPNKASYLINGRQESTLNRLGSF